MFGARTPRTALVAFTLFLASLALGVGALPSVATAAETHRAAVIVDTGAGVHKVVITFSEDSITGIDALQRAGANPVIYAMGPGAAVCRLWGVGRDAGPSCLGGTDGDNNYWAYWRAPAGSSSFSYSRVGGGASQVHDGDVEGWKFGTGTAPAYVSLASLTAPPPPPSTARPPATTPPTKAPAGPGATAAGGGTPPGSTAPGVAGVVPPSSSTLPVTGGGVKPTTKTTVPGVGAKTNTHETRDSEGSEEAGASGAADGRTVNTTLASSDSDSSATWSYLGLALLLVAIAGAIFFVRRGRRKPV
jgi:hypothetical protein